MQREYKTLTINLIINLKPNHMKIELIKNDKGQTQGWSIIAENKEDKLTLGTMRNIEFFGMDDNAIEYNGMKSEDGYAIKLNYATKAYIKNKEVEFRATLKKSNEL